MRHESAARLLAEKPFFVATSKSNTLVPASGTEVPAMFGETCAVGIIPTTPPERLSCHTTYQGTTHRLTSDIVPTYCFSQHSHHPPRRAFRGPGGVRSATFPAPLCACFFFTLSTSRSHCWGVGKAGGGDKRKEGGREGESWSNHIFHAHTTVGSTRVALTINSTEMVVVYFEVIE